LDQNTMQTAATIYCNQLEYQNGGMRTPYCEKNYFTADDINKIVSITSSAATKSIDAIKYAEIPTTTNLAPSRNEINLKALLAGKPIRFSVPHGNTDWLLKNKWIFFREDLRRFAFYVRTFEPFLPGLTCAKTAQFTVTTGDQTRLYDQPTSTLFFINFKRYGWIYTTSGNCASGIDFNFKNAKDGTTTRVCSVAERKPNTHEVIPGLFTEFWQVQLRIPRGACSQKQLDDAAKTIESIPFRVSYKLIPLPKTHNDGDAFMNWCWPDPCKHGGVCSNDLIRMTYSCKCRNGASGASCQNVPNHCAKMKCPGGTCINSLERGTCSCGMYQHYSGTEQRCIPSNCNSMPDLCGKVKCVDTNTGPKCVCPENQIYWANLKACKADYCKAGHCGNNKCLNQHDRATCHCKTGEAYNPETKKCFNYCQKGACPSGAGCRTLTRGKESIPYAQCDCPSSFPIYWEKEKKCTRDHCSWGWPCGKENCYNSIKWAHCVCPDKTRFMKRSKSCEAQKCEVGGNTPHCGNFYPTCLNSGRKVCGSWKGGCWGDSRQFQCCNYC